MILLVVGLGSYMSALDSSIVNVALPVITRTTGAPVSTVEWVALAYLVTTSASLLLFGRLADIYGQRRIFLLGQVVFVLASLGCGMAGKIGLLIGARVLQALGCAMIFAVSPGLLLHAFPPSERGRALGMQATMTYLGVATGPVLGGFLIELAGWPAIFYVNLPIGIIIIWIATRVLRNDAHTVAQPFDPMGALLLGVALISLLFVLSKGGEWGWLHPLIVCLTTLGLASLLIFVIMENTVSHPALNLSLFKNRMFSGSVIAAYLCYVSSSSVTFLMPFFLMNGVGLSARETGSYLVAIPVCMVLLTGFSGWLSDRIGVRLPATAGMFCMALGITLLSTIQLDFKGEFLIFSLAMVGVGSGLFTSPNNSAIMGSAPVEHRGVAGAILAIARTVGFATGIAVAGMIYTGILIRFGSVPEGVACAVRSALMVTVVATLAGGISSLLRSTGK